MDNLIMKMQWSNGEACKKIKDPKKVSAIGMEHMAYDSKQIDIHAIFKTNVSKMFLTPNVLIHTGHLNEDSLLGVILEEIR